MGGERMKRFTVYLLTGSWKGELASFRTLEEAKAYAGELFAKKPEYAQNSYIKVWAHEDGEWFVVRTIDL